MEYLSGRMLEAYEFAAKAHEGQYRKNPGKVPYFSHAAAVASVLIRAQFEEEVVIAALLHDVIEDTGCGADAIGQRFGQRVLELVLGVTEDKSVPWDARRQGYNDNLRRCDEQTLGISGADLLANCMSMVGEFAKGNNPWAQLSRDPARYAERKMAYDRERIRIIRERVRHPFVLELAAVHERLAELTGQVRGHSRPAGLC